MAQEETGETVDTLVRACGRLGDLETWTRAGFWFLALLLLVLVVGEAPSGGLPESQGPGPRAKLLRAKGLLPTCPKSFWVKRWTPAGARQPG